jgi:hypothetical protein
MPSHGMYKYRGVSVSFIFGTPISSHSHFAVRALDRECNRAVWHCGAVLLGGLFMIWPALCNRYPVLYPDSISYLGGGRLVARAIFLHKFSTNYGGRSLIYGLGILPMHWNITPWPVVALHAFLTAYLIWLVVQSIVPQARVMSYFGLVIPLSLFTSLGWFVSLNTPDILGPVLYLSTYLLVFAGETISPRERMAVVLIAWWAVASHITHLILASGLCFLLAAVLVLQRQPVRSWLGVISKVAMIIFACSGSTPGASYVFIWQTVADGQKTSLPVGPSYRRRPRAMVSAASLWGSEVRNLRPRAADPW